MKRFYRSRPSPAMIVACLALFVALGGTSVAVISALPANSVGTAQLKNGAVTVGVLPNMTNYYSKTQANSRYLRGTISEVKTVAVSSSNYNFDHVSCPTGYQAVGGGVDVGSFSYMAVMDSSPWYVSDTAWTLSDGLNAAATGWFGGASNVDTVSRSFKIVAICAPIA